MGKGTGRGSRRGGRRGPPAPVAALDLGTNNCRLLIAVPGRGGHLRVVDSFSRIVRLGEGLTQSGLLSQAAIDRTVEALKICAQHLGQHQVRRLRAVATQACRQARNADVLLARARDEAGIELEIISAEEEARLASVGCAPLIDAKAQGGLIFDNGGGSTEIVWMRRDEAGVPRIAASASESTGVVVLAEAWAPRPLDRAAFEHMRRELLERFAPVKARMEAQAPFDPKVHHLLGTSGTVTTLAALALGLPRYERGRVDASWHASRDILAVIEKLVALDHDGRAALGAVGQDRADLIVPGCAIFAAIHTLWPCEHLRVADRGLREGMLRELMAAR